MRPLLALLVAGCSVGDRYLVDRADFAALTAPLPAPERAADGARRFGDAAVEIRAVRDGDGAPCAPAYAGRIVEGDRAYTFTGLCPAPDDDLPPRSPAALDAMAEAALRAHRAARRLAATRVSDGAHTFVRGGALVPASARPRGDRVLVEARAPSSLKRASGALSILAGVLATVGVALFAVPCALPLFCPELGSRVLLPLAGISLAFGIGFAVAAPSHDSP